MKENMALPSRREEVHRKAIPPNNQAPDRDLVLSELRHVSAYLRFVTAEVDMTGQQLRAGRITVAQALWIMSNLTDPVGLLNREAAQ
jgi:hypothetical protein